MNNFIFENSSKVYFGEGCVKEYLSNILSAYGDTVMLCYGGGSIKKNGIYNEVITVLKKEKKAVVEFSGIPSNPTYSKVLEGVKLAKESNADLILVMRDGNIIEQGSHDQLMAENGFYADLYNSQFTEEVA